MSGGAAIASGVKLISLFARYDIRSNNSVTRAHLLNNNSEIQIKLRPALAVWLGGATLCDVMIAVCMTHFVRMRSICARYQRLMVNFLKLWNAFRPRAGFGGSDVLLTRLIRLTIESGTVTASVQLLDLIFDNAFPRNNLHMAPCAHRLLP